MKSRNLLVPTLAIFMGSLVLTGCPPKKKLAIEEKPKEEEVVEEKKEETAPIQNEVKINQDWAEISALSMVNFDYDSVQVGESQRSVLKKNVAVIKKLPLSVTIRVEGHCDDRGTVEYNIALGQRRADAVRTFYVTAGIPKRRIKTISFGEERPLCNLQTEDCWAKNRRAVTTVRNDEPLTLNADNLSQ